jgi:hypothetical protein
MIFFILACGEEISKDTSTSEPSSEEETTGTYNPTAQVEWGEEQLVVYMSNTEGYDFYFGIVESTEECTQNIEYGCWTGEDCSPTEPYMSSDESILLGPYCHPADGEGVAIALNYSSGFDSIFQGAEVVSGGVQTAFPAPILTGDTGTENIESYEFLVTYYLEDRISGKCWSWGIDPGYFKDRNCNLPVPTSGWSKNAHVVILE